MGLLLVKHVLLCIWECLNSDRWVVAFSSLLDWKRMSWWAEAVTKGNKYKNRWVEFWFDCQSASWVCIVISCLLSSLGLSSALLWLCFLAIILGPPSTSWNTCASWSMLCVFRIENTLWGGKGLLLALQNIKSFGEFVVSCTCPCYLKYAGNMKLCIEPVCNILSCNYSETQIYGCRQLRNVNRMVDLRLGTLWELGIMTYACSTGVYEAGQLMTQGQPEFHSFRPARKI